MARPVLASLAVLIASACGDASVTSPTATGNAAVKAAAPGSAGVLILASTVSGGTSSKEALTAAALGFTVTVVNDAQWAALTAADFSSYRAIILGDPNCRTGVAPVAAAAANRMVWGPVVNGNIFIIGTDPVLHSKALVTEKGVAFATAVAGKTGAYITTSCYYHGVAANTPVTFLDGLSSLGSFKATGVPGCYDNAYKVANHPALNGLTSAYLSGWGCAVHNAFNQWPTDFEVLAIARSGSIYTASDGTVGTPYILARGEGLTVISDIQLTPAATTVAVGTAQTLTATVLSNNAPVVNKPVTFTIEDGLNTGTTQVVQTDANGVATFSVTSATPGTSGVRARFVDALGRTQTSGRAAVTWEVPADLTPPTITADITGTLGSADWYTSDVAITWTVVDNETPITSQTGCGAVSVTTDGSAFSFTCSATSTGGTASQTVTIKRDASAPTLAPLVIGTLGTNGWYTSDVSVNFTAGDPTSGVAADHGDHHGGAAEVSDCHDINVDEDTQGVTFTCTVFNGAGLETTRSVTLKRDASAPTVAATITGALGSNGWYTSDVTVSWTTSDLTSGSTACAPNMLTSDHAGTSYTCTATNGAGLTASQTVSVKKDETRPVVTYAGNVGSYTVDQMVSISCTPSDAMSGVASSTCAPVSGAAYEFAVGNNSFSATATDRAGNTGGASTGFTVSVTTGSLCALVERFVSHHGTQNSLCVKLKAAQAARDRGGNNTGAGSMGAFINEVEAQTGKRITSAHAAILISLAQAW